MNRWRTWTSGPCPDTGGRRILVRLRCQTREEVERRNEPQPPGWWKRWVHDGGPGDIVEIKEV